MTIGEAIYEATRQIGLDRQQTARLDADLLMMKVLSCRREDLLIESNRSLESERLETFFSFVERRRRGEPVAYITGTKDFFGESFNVGPGVLIPRPETEFLVEETLKWCAENHRDHPRILDLGCGSGCVGISLLKNLPGSTLVGIDISTKAIEHSVLNASCLGVADRARFLQMDLSSEGSWEIEKLKLQRVDVVVANPPYIASGDQEVEMDVLKYEPHEALFSGATGLETLALWLTRAIEVSARKSSFCFEIGQGQGQMAIEVFSGLKVFDEVRLGKDYAGKDRWVSAERKGVGDG